jgi:RHS repeat-associated protein
MVKPSLTQVTFGSADSDSFTYDPNTGRMTGYTFSVNSQTDVGALTWNTNGTLNQLKITDGITGTTDSQTCNYLYDDLQRLSSSNCGAIWTQNFTYDAFGNITKTGNSQFMPGYSPTQNQFTSIPGRNVSYDGDGNLLTDNLNTYTWDVYGRMSTVNTGSATVTAIYDALGRMVENNAGGSYTEFIYGPTGVKLAQVNGSTLIKAFVALPGGAKAIYNSSGTLAYFRHSDWLGSSRLTSTATKPTSMYSSTAYAPFGESQQGQTSGTADASFTGQDQDTVSSLYDFPARRYSPSQGRWISPDPLGRGAVTLANPQSWNRYVYVNNNPLRLVDPNGTTDVLQIPCDAQQSGCQWGAGGGGNEAGGGGGGGGSDDSSGNDDNSGDPCAANPDSADCIDTDNSGPSSVPADQACVTGALEQVIMAGEGTSGPNGYGTLVNGTVLSAPGFPNLVGQTGTSRNPIVIDPNTLSGFPNIQVQVNQQGLISHAFGAFQFMPGTWTQYGGGSDVSPSAQDDVAANLLQSVGAVGAAMSGNFQDAMWDANTTWASLPDSPYGQPTMGMSQAFSIYQNAMTDLPECQTENGSMVAPQPGG